MEIYNITTTGHIADESGNELRTEKGEAQRTKYYSVWDKEAFRYLATAKNSPNLDELANDMEGYFIQDGDDKIELTGETVTEELNFYGFEIHGHNELITE